MNPNDPNQVHQIDHNTFRLRQEHLMQMELQKKIPMGTQVGEETEVFVNNDMSRSNINRPQ